MMEIIFLIVPQKKRPDRVETDRAEELRVKPAARAESSGRFFIFLLRGRLAR